MTKLRKTLKIMLFVIGIVPLGAIYLNWIVCGKWDWDFLD
jgi:uncharacterized membrane protein (Fun14 family)